MDHAAHEPFNYVTSFVLIFFGTQLAEQMMHCVLSLSLSNCTVTDFEDNCLENIEKFLSISFDFIHRVHKIACLCLFILLPWVILSEEM